MGEHSFRRRVSNYLSTARRTARERGWGFAIRHVLLSGLKNYWSYHHNRAFSPRRRTPFVYRGRKMPYFFHHYNNAWSNERTVEIPIARQYLRKARQKGHRVLELGNVMSHYYDTDHLVVDKYEKAPGVVNEDIVDFHTDERFDLILTVSTLEHIGWDEVPFEHRKLGEPGKIVATMKRLRELLAPGGIIVVTVPVGHNPGLDRLLGQGELGFDEMYCMKRVSRDNRWEQVGWDDVKDSKIGNPYPKANSLVVGVLRRPAGKGRKGRKGRGRKGGGRRSGGGSGGGERAGERKG